MSRSRDDDVVRETTRVLGLFSWNLHVVGALAHDLTARGDAETLLGTAVGLVLRHGEPISLCCVAWHPVVGATGDRVVGATRDHGIGVAAAAAWSA